MTTRMAWLLTLTAQHPALTGRWWSGQNDLAFGGETYSGALGPNGPVVAIGVMAAGTNIPDQRLSVTIAANTPAAIQWFSIDRGPMSAVVEWLFMKEGGSWTSTGMKVNGRVSNADLDIENGIWSAEIETVGGVEYVVPDRWDHSSQLRRHAGDEGFIYAAQLAGGISIPWP